MHMEPSARACDHIWWDQCRASARPAEEADSPDSRSGTPLGVALLRQRLQGERLPPTPDVRLHHRAIVVAQEQHGRPNSSYLVHAVPRLSTRVRQGLQKNCPGLPWREIEPRRGAGDKCRIHPGAQYLRLIWRHDWPGVPKADLAQ